MTEAKPLEVAPPTEPGPDAAYLGSPAWARLEDQITWYSTKSAEK
jgi:hypothetical protein